MAEEKRGIEETKDILDFVFSFVEAVGKAKKVMQGMLLILSKNYLKQ